MQRRSEVGERGGVGCEERCNCDGVLRDDGLPGFRGEGALFGRYGGSGGKTNLQIRVLLEPFEDADQHQLIR